MAKPRKLHASLARLGERYRDGVARLRPVDEKVLAAVRLAVEKDWEKTQGLREKEGHESGVSAGDAERQKESGKAQARRSQRSASKSQGHSH